MPDRDPSTWTFKKPTSKEKRKVERLRKRQEAERKEAEARQKAKEEAEKAEEERKRKAEEEYQRDLEDYRRRQAEDQVVGGTVSRTAPAAPAPVNPLTAPVPYPATAPLATQEPDEFTKKIIQRLIEDAMQRGRILR